MQDLREVTTIITFMIISKELYSLFMVKTRRQNHYEFWGKDIPLFLLGWLATILIFSVVMSLSNLAFFLSIICIFLIVSCGSSYIEAQRQA